MASLAKGELPHVFLLAGEESYYIRRAEEAILRRLLPNEDERADALIRYEEMPPIETLMEALETAPFFTDKMVVLDAKMNFDDSALFRHPDIAVLRDESEEDPKERVAAASGLNYVNLGGDVACMVNGAGLAMATVDMLKFYGGEPANFLDVGGDSEPEKIAKAFKIMLEGGQAKGIFVNIMGGINRCDNIAKGIIEAAHIISEDGHSLPVPVVVRLEGSMVEEGREILRNTPISNVFTCPSMEKGAEQIVQLVAEAREKE